MRLPQITVLDAMIAVVAVALVTSNVRYVADWERRIHDDPFPAPRRGWTALGVVIRAPIAISKCATPLAVLTAAGLIALLRNRKRGPIGQGLAWDPGRLACLSATVALGIGIPLHWVETAGKAIAVRGLSSRTWNNPFLSEPWPIINAGVYASSSAAAFAVAGAWICLRLLGRPRTEGDWLDLTGRILGAGWFVMVLNQWVLAGVAGELMRCGR